MNTKLGPEGQELRAKYNMRKFSGKTPYEKKTSAIPPMLFLGEWPVSPLNKAVWESNVLALESPTNTWPLALPAYLCRNFDEFCFLRCRAESSASNGAIFGFLTERMQGIMLWNEENCYGKMSNRYDRDLWLK